MSVWAAMQAEHDEMWELVNQLTGGAGEPRDPPDVRQAVARRLVALAAGHEFTEAAVIWPVVRERCPEGEELVAEATEQESVERWALNSLRAISAGSLEFDETVHTIAGQFRTHLSYEQNQIWPRLVDELSAAEADELETRWHAARRVAPSRPLPHLPADPRVLAVVSRLTSALGRARSSAATPR
jgi:hypothetical protein